MTPSADVHVSQVTFEGACNVTMLPCVFGSMNGSQSDAVVALLKSEYQFCLLGFQLLLVLCCHGRVQC